MIYLHEYGYYDQSVGALSSFCVVCVQLVVVVDELNLDTHTKILSQYNQTVIIGKKTLQLLYFSETIE